MLLRIINLISKVRAANLFAWGKNSSYQFGDGTTISTTAPLEIGTSSWSQISVGKSHTIALKADGTLWAWGDNNNCQLGDGIRKEELQKVDVTIFSDVAYGTSHAVAIKPDGTLWAWGDNINGKLGAGVTANTVISPVQIGTSLWSKIAAEDGMTAAIDSDGYLYTWGVNSANYRLGDGTTANRSSPVMIGARGDTWSKVALGSNYGLAISSTGALYGWGANAVGQLGDGTTITKSFPERIGTRLNWSQISAGINNSAGILATGALFTWGGNSASWQLGDGTTANRSSPVQIATSTSWSQVSAGNHSFAITSLGALYAWGLNSTSGQLGDGTKINRSLPVPIGTSSWSKVLAASDFRMSAAIRIDGLLFMWGSNNVGQLGDGTTTDRASPVQISALTWNTVSVRGRATAALTTANELYTSGASISEYSKFIRKFYRSEPIQIGTSSWSQISAGALHNLAIRSDGKMFGWGDNRSGQVGNGTTIKVHSPVQIGTSSWSQVSAGGDDALYSIIDPLDTNFADGITFISGNPYGHSAAIRSDGALFTWGNNSFYQLGDGTTNNTSSPVRIGTSSWSQINAGSISTAGILTTGALFGWSAEIAAGYCISPVQIGTFSWSKVSVRNHALAIRSDGLLFSWGNNNVGQLGDGTTISKSINSPVQIGTGSWAQINVGISDNSYAIAQNGTLYAWGYNADGILGDGTTVNKSSPVQITGYSWKQISSHGATAVGILQA